jgi:hypothetical protein
MGAEEESSMSAWRNPVEPIPLPTLVDFKETRGRVRIDWLQLSNLCVAALFMNV